ncbi:hypothetical protein M8J77_012302 [Diaphorina citri]|nr:hypothetical protein M8J77_007271 [Diaphorina citri]KAI5715214.1 hypothetical protein M8J77_012302 [Diaphorina citri]
MDNNRAVWKIFTNTPHQGKRLPGRPRSCWINELKRLCNRWGLNDWEELTQHIPIMTVKIDGGNCHNGGMSQCERRKEDRRKSSVPRTNHISLG